MLKFSEKEEDTVYGMFENAKVMEGVLKPEATIDR